jgi:hypothetical protein
MMTCREWDKGFIAARENSCENEHFQEMALMGKVASNKDLPKGMRIDVITTEFKGTGEEPHFHLFPANHITKNGKSNNYDLITRVKITENPPNNPDSVQPIVDNPPVPKEYQKAIWEWAFQTKRGVTNWERTKIVWEAQAAAVSYGQV